jgi:hypothetical protein
MIFSTPTPRLIRKGEKSVPSPAWRWYSMKAAPEGVTMREKPNFQLVRPFVVDPEYFSHDLVEALRDILLRRAKLSAVEAGAFLQQCHTEAQFTREYLVVNSKADTRDRLNLIAKKAADLLDAMKGLSGESVNRFNLEFDNLSFCPDPSLELSCNSREDRLDDDGGRFLGAAWDAITDLEAVAKHAATTLYPDRNDHVISQNAGRFIWNICEEYRRITGKFPPYSKGLWFPEFMEKLVLWKGLRLPVGRARIEAVIKAMRLQRGRPPS